MPAPLSPGGPCLEIPQMVNNGLTAIICRRFPPPHNVSEHITCGFFIQRCPLRAPSCNLGQWLILNNWMSHTAHSTNIKTSQCSICLLTIHTSRTAQISAISHTVQISAMAHTAQILAVAHTAPDLNSGTQHVQPRSQQWHIQPRSWQ